MRRLLQLLDFSKGLCFMSVRSQVSPVLFDVIKEKGVEMPSNGHIPLVLFRLPKEKALEIQIE